MRNLTHHVVLLLAAVNVNGVAADPAYRCRIGQAPWYTQCYRGGKPEYNAADDSCKCSCPSGFSGVSCEDGLCVGGANNEPCENGGQAVRCDNKQGLSLNLQQNEIWFHHSQARQDCLFRAPTKCACQCPINSGFYGVNCETAGCATPLGVGSNGKYLPHSSSFFPLIFHI